MTLPRKIAVFLAALAYFSPPLCAGQSQGRTLAGTVRLGRGSQPDIPIEVTLYTALGSRVDLTFTDNAGNFTFYNLRPGSYKLVAHHAGFQDASTEVMVYSSAQRTAVVPLLLTPIEPDAPGLSLDTVDPVELRLNDETKAHFQQGQRALAKGKFDEARKHLELTLKVEPDFAAAHHFLGVASTLAGDYPKAESSLRRAVELDSRRADFHFALGKVLNLLGRPQESMPVIDRGLEISSHSAFGLFEKSRAQYLLKQYSSAVTTATQALAEQPGPAAEVHLILANSYIHLHRHAEAADSLETYLRLVPESTSAPKAREVLARIKADLKRTVPD